LADNPGTRKPIKNGKKLKKTTSGAYVAILCENGPEIVEKEKYTVAHSI
jgi:hypothetical protein